MNNQKRVLKQVRKRIGKGQKRSISGYLVLLLLTLYLVMAMSTVFCQAEEISGGVYISEIQTTPSQILSNEEIKAITESYEGRRVTMSELKEVVKKINDLYWSKGYVTAKAILPAQKIKGKTVKIKLVEGSLGKILLKGNKDTKDSYFLKRISIKSGDLIKLDTLKNELFYFNASNDVSLKAELKAGKDYGTTDLILKVKEPKKNHYTLFADNGGREETGLYRYGLKIANSSLFGHRDRLNLTLMEAEGTQGGSLSYSLPTDNRGARLALSYNKNTTDIISGEYKSVNIEGNYQEYGISFIRPIKIRPGFKMEGALEYHRKVSDTYFSGVNLLTTDANTYGITITTQSVRKNKVWYSSNNLLVGLASSGKDEHTDPGTNDQFIKYSGYFENQRKLKDQSILTLKASLQITNNRLLPSSEQFTLGGMSTVRGYQEGKLIGDQGYCINIENTRKLNDKIDYFVFLDNGGVYPYKGNEESINKDDYLTGAGLGLNIRFTEKISARIVLGHPLDGEEGVRTHFAIQTVW